jgi:predicted esterase
MPENRMNAAGYLSTTHLLRPPVTTHACSRRTFVELLGGGLAALAGCSTGPTDPVAGSARLGARPGVPVATIAPGLWPLDLGIGRDGAVLVPASYAAAVPAPLMLLLHGAGGSAEDMLEFRSADAEREGIVLLAVDSRADTWDAIRGTYGPDVAFIDLALTWTFARCRVDPDHVIVEGFSDGASYSLGLGTANGDLFSRVVALSPGFIPAFSGDPVGNPPIFVAHGTQDLVLPIDQTSRYWVPILRDEGYTVEYIEHDGGHMVPAEVAAQALAWSLA